jgi:O-antigen ligase
MHSLKNFSAAALATLLFAGILTQWVQHRWAVSLFQTGAFALAICWAIWFALRPFALEGSVLLVPLSAASMWGLLQLAFGQTVYRWETWDSVLKWGTNLTVFFLALQIFSEPALRERFLRAILYFATVLSVVGSIQMFSSDGRIFWLFPTEYKEFVVGPFVYHTQYAGFIELVLPLAVVGALEDRQRMLSYAAIAAALYASVIVSASRVGTVLVSAEILAIFLLAPRRSQLSMRARGLTLALVTGFALLFTAVVGWQTLLHRFFQSDPYAVRREFLQSSLAMIRDRPWMGFGLGTWSTAYPRYALFDNGLFANQAHNDWAQWTVEGGVPFLLFMLWIAARSVASAVRSLWGIGVVAVFAHSLIDYPLGRPALAGFFFVFLGVIESARRSPKKILTL